MIAASQRRSGLDASCEHGFRTDVRPACRRGRADGATAKNLQGPAVAGADRRVDAGDGCRSGSVSAVLTGTKLAVTGTFDGLKSPATIAQVHKSPTRGVRGPERARSRGREDRRRRAARSAARSISPPSRSPTSKRDGSTCSCTARRPPTATCGAGCCRRRTSDDRRSARGRRPLVASLRARAASVAGQQPPAAGLHRQPGRAGRDGLRGELRELSHGRSRRAERSAAAGRQQLPEHVATRIDEAICSSSSSRRCRRPART